jgi:hypothetical protein
MKNITSLDKLQSEFGPCELMVLGYNDRDNTPDNGWDWCAAVLPGNNIGRFLIDRTKAGRRGNFLFALASTGNLRGQGGVKHALYGFALAAGISWPARELLHKHQLEEPLNLDENGHFKFPNGVPILRLWRPKAPTPLATLMGRPVSFDQNTGARGVRSDNPILIDLVKAAATLPLWETILHRPQPIPDVILKELRRISAPVAEPSSATIEPLPPPAEERVVRPDAVETERVSPSDAAPETPHSDVPLEPTELEGLVKEVVIEASEREVLQRLAPEQREKAYRDHEARRVSGLVEVRSGSGFCDILTNDEIIEVKSFVCWRHALGQVLAYSRFHYGRRCRIHLFDAGASDLTEVSQVCTTFGVGVSFIR